MTIQWALAILMLIMSAFLFGLCAVIFAFYASKRHKYLLHIALMSSSYLLFAGVIAVQISFRMFGVRMNQWIVYWIVFAALALGIAGLARMWRHRRDENKLSK